ncbi:MAG: hypothetical protein D6743_12860 [Calditrichaeota bacterium]|nr:MAG: hypothetical protein D6743_12860 [Calditrichota bacterium]
MRKMLLLLMLFGVALAPNGMLAGEGSSTGAAQVLSHSKQTEFREGLAEYFAHYRANTTEEKQLSVNVTGRKSVAKAALFSAVLPGSGEFYGGSYLKGAAFLVIEAAALFGHFHFQSRGNDLEDRFRADANRFWNEDAYWDWISVISGKDRNDLDALRAYESATFSHFLPKQKNQQYYENIGKYDQFVVGWQDFREDVLHGDVAGLTLEDYRSGFYNGADLTTISGERNIYVDIRRDANDNFQRATNMVTIAIFNHLISAFDAGLTVKRHNRKLFTARLRMEGLVRGNELVPAMGVGVTW